MFAKPLSALAKADIDRIIIDEIAEGTEVEFKETLPAKKGVDPWVAGTGSISDYARNKILEEIIAFANAYGGTLIIGVSETDDQPRRASAIRPINRCGELADRFRLICRDCIEPQIPLLEVTGVVTENDRDGVVVIRVPRSRVAPHRHCATLECYFRHADRTERMTMREIQDLTLTVRQRIEEIESKFSKFSSRFKPALLKKFGAREGLGIRASLVPLDDIYIHKVHGMNFFQPALQKFVGRFSNKGNTELFLPIYSGHWRPIMRGTQGQLGEDKFCCIVDVYCDGMLNFVFFTEAEQGRKNQLFPNWLIGLIASGLFVSERFRQVAGTPSCEYALEVEILTIGSPIIVMFYGGNSYGRTLGEISDSDLMFPRYSVGEYSDFPQLIATIERDFFNAAGFDNKDSIEIEFPAI